jgi:polysaccharide biosynthesis protein PelF
MEIALLTEGTYPYSPGGVSVWCDQLVRGLAPHRFTVHAITAHADNTTMWELPDNVMGVRPVPLWDEAPTPKRSVRHSFALSAAFEQLAVSIARVDGREMFLDALHQLYEIAQVTPLAGALRTKESLTVLLGAMQEAISVDRESVGDAEPATVLDANVALTHIDHLLRPLYVPPPEADLCHAAANGLSVLMALSAHWSYKTPLVLSEHGIYLRERYLSFGHRNFSFAVRSTMLRFYRHLTWAGYQIANTIAPGSEYNRRWQEANGAASDRIRPVYNGVDAGEFVTSSTEPDVPTVVWLGRIDPLKDVETLIRSFALIREQLPTARLRIFGAASKENESYLERCVALRDELGLEESAAFEGRASSVVEAYHAGHVVVMTSISEGFPFTLIEAMAAGKATVATDVGGMREATGTAGLIVPPQDPERTAAACVRLLTETEFRHSIGRAARARVLSMFTLEQSLALFGDVYREATGRIASAQVIKSDFDQALDAMRALTTVESS